MFSGSQAGGFAMKFPKPWHRKGRGWFVTFDGRQIKLGTKRAEAFDRYRQLIAEPKKRAVPSDSLLAIIDVFLEWVQRHRSGETYEWYRYRLQRFSEKYPDLRAGDLRPYHVETWADAYDQSVTSRRNYLRSVKRCMKWAKKQGYTESNPIADLEVPAAEAKEVCVSPEEFTALLGWVKSGPLADLIEVTYECGCRPQELLRVTAKEVDLENKRWVFPRSGSKGKKLSRVVYLPDKSLDITKRLLLKHGDGGPLFRNSSGRPWTTDAVNCGFLAVQMRMGKDEMQRLGETIPEEGIAALIPTLQPMRRVKGKSVQKNAAELRCEAKRKLTHTRAAKLAPRYSLYSLRHSFATNALQRGVDSLTVAVLLGHQDPSTLSKVYQHLSLDPEHMLKQAHRAAG
jgi:integrase